MTLGPVQLQAKPSQEDWAGLSRDSSLARSLRVVAEGLSDPDRNLSGGLAASPSSLLPPPCVLCL